MARGGRRMWEESRNEGEMRDAEGVSWGAVKVCDEERTVLDCDAHNFLQVSGCG